MSKLLAAKGIGARLKLVLNARLRPVTFGTSNWREGLVMSFDEESERTRSLHIGEPCPPDFDRPRSAAMSIESLYRREAPRLERVIARRSGPQDAIDLVHDCFKRLVATAAWSLGSVKSPKAYLTRSAQNAARNEVRGEMRRQINNHQDYDDRLHGDDRTERQLEARDELRLIERRLRKMNAKTRDIFLMHRLDGLSYEEIGEIKGMTARTVKHHFAKAMYLISRDRGPR